MGRFLNTGRGTVRCGQHALRLLLTTLVLTITASAGEELEVPGIVDEEDFLPREEEGVTPDPRPRAEEYIPDAPPGTYEPSRPDTRLPEDMREELPDVPPLIPPPPPTTANRNEPHKDKPLRRSESPTEHDAPSDQDMVPLTPPEGTETGQTSPAPPAPREVPREDKTKDLPDPLADLPLPEEENLEPKVETSTIPEIESDVVPVIEELPEPDLDTEPAPEATAETKQLETVVKTDSAEAFPSANLPDPLLDDDDGASFWKHQTLPTKADDNPRETDPPKNSRPEPSKAKTPDENPPQTDPVAATAETQSPMRHAVAVLDGEAITRQALYEQIAPTHGRSALQRMINRRLLAAELQRQGERITREEMELAFDQAAARFAKGVESDSRTPSLEAYLLERGMPKQKYMREVVWVRLALRKLMKKALQISEDDLFNYYYTHREKYTEPDRLRLLMIFIDPLRLPGASGETVPTRADWTKALKQAQTLLQQLAGDAAFEELARTHSHDPLSAMRGGNVGLRARNELPRAVADVSFKMELNEPSPPIKSLSGYYIVKVTEKKPGRIIPFTQITERIRADYEDFMVLANAEELLNRLNEQARREGRLEILDPALQPAEAGK